MVKYVTNVVNRYKSRKGIWAWEFTNEVNLYVDLPGGSAQYWPTNTYAGYPSQRIHPQDDITDTTLSKSLSAFAQLVHNLDPYKRAVISGNSLPRPSAYHLMQGQGWTVDSYDQFSQMLSFQQPGVDFYTGHTYTTTIGDPQFDGLIRIPWCMQAAKAAKQPFGIMEWGASGATTSTQDLFNRYLAAIESNKVPISALWVMQYPGQPDWTVTPTNNRSYQLTGISAANTRMRAMLPNASGQLLFKGLSSTPPGQIDVQLRNPGSTTSFLNVACDIHTNGSFTLRLPAPSAFNVSIKPTTYLRKSVAVDATTGNATIGTLTLVNGDVNGDNVVDAKDLAVVKAALGSHSGSANWNSKADVNGDGVVDSKDSDIVQANLGKKGDR